MTQQKQNSLTNWLLGLSTTIAVASVGFAWDTNAKLSVLVDHDKQHATEEFRISLKQDNMQLKGEDFNTRITRLEDKIKNP